MLTPTQLRIHMAALYELGITNITEMWKKLTLFDCNDQLHTDSETGEIEYIAEKRNLFNLARNSLLDDVHAILEYRKRCDPVNIDTFVKWFPYLSEDTYIYQSLDTNRDFIYNSHGLRLLINRYLKKNEPIQYGMLRIARLFGRIPKITDDIKPYSRMYTEEWLMFYGMLSCGFIHVSSTVANAECVDSTILPGEACRLIVPTKRYDATLVKQIEKVCTTISLGVGVGMAASTLPLYGSRENGCIRNGFSSIVRKIDACHHMCLYERKPKIAMYINIHNDTIYEAFELKHPAKLHLENSFIGVMISDYFIKCLKNDAMWYLFPGNVTLNNENLCDFYGEEYERKYHEFVEAKLYSKCVPAKQLMDDLITSLCVSGSPYIIFDDHVNHFSNHRHLGKIKTLNLCAEITNYADEERSSSCTLLSVNFAMFRDFPHVLESIYAHLKDRFPRWHKIHFDMPELTKYAFAVGFMGTCALNNLLGNARKYREIGISPLGVYDMALMAGLDPVDVCANISEAMYLGAIQGSCYNYRRTKIRCKHYIGSPFSLGCPQWALRNVIPKIDWRSTLFDMKTGMSNSMLTAQAPTATTSMLTGATESVTLPISLFFVKESENGRNGMMVYGHLFKILNQPLVSITLDCNIKRQIAMYAVSAPFIDQSQSTMFSVDLSKQAIFNLIIDTYKAKLKTGIYYVLPKQQHRTLSTVRDLTKVVVQRSKCNDDHVGEDVVGSVRGPNCEACSM